MKLHSGVLGLVALLAAVQLAAGQGTVIVQHSGYNDPTTEGFIGGFVGARNIQVGPVTNDLGMNAWSISESSAGTGYDASIPNLSGLDWELTGILRVVTPGTANTVFSLNIFTGTEGFSLDFGSQANSDPTFRVQGSSLSPLLVLNGAGSTYNTYQLIYDAPSDTASLWVNGVEELGDIYGRTGGASSFASIAWGIGNNQVSSSTANWNLVSVETIPEPSPAGLLLLGGGVLFFLRRKYRR